MTGEELIQWIKDNKAEHIYFRVQYRDDGGYYYGYDYDINPVIEKDMDCDCYVTI